jgi:hypothetical protein
MSINVGNNERAGVITLDDIGRMNAPAGDIDSGGLGNKYHANNGMIHQMQMQQQQQ